MGEVIRTHRVGLRPSYPTLHSELHLETGETEDQISGEWHSDLNYEIFSMEFLGPNVFCCGRVTWDNSLQCS